MRAIGIYRDDPTSVAEEKLRSRAGVTTSKRLALEPPLAYGEIAGGPYAVLRHKGPYADMRAAYLWSRPTNYYRSRTYGSLSRPLSQLPS